MPYADWASVTRALDTTLERLTDGEFLILGEPVSLRRPSRGQFPLPHREASTRYVQVLRVGEVLSAECVGATSMGGTWTMHQHTIEQLRGLGWLTPAECLVEFGNVTPNFGQYVDVETAGALPDVLAASLAVLGARPESLVLEHAGGLARQPMVPSQERRRPLGERPWA